MSNCAFCAEKRVEISAGGLGLCARCRDQLCALRPEDPCYFWYARAVRRALAQSDGKGAAVRGSAFGAQIAIPRSRPALIKSIPPLMKSDGMRNYGAITFPAVRGRS